jgi:hypothetical protein
VAAVGVMAHDDPFFGEHQVKLGLGERRQLVGVRFPKNVSQCSCAAGLEVSGMYEIMSANIQSSTWWGKTGGSREPSSRRTTGFKLSELTCEIVGSSSVAISGGKDIQSTSD